MLFRSIKETVQEGSIIFTDEYQAYKKIMENYSHGYVSHGNGEYARGVVHTNSIEGFWTQLKRTVGGTHVSVSPKYLQAYANECAFRYNNRKAPSNMFDIIIKNLPVVTETATTN